MRETRKVGVLSDAHVTRRFRGGGIASDGDAVLRWARFLKDMRWGTGVVWKLEGWKWSGVVEAVFAHVRMEGMICELRRLGRSGG